MIDSKEKRTVLKKAIAPNQVLVIDDEESIRALLKEYFEILGLKVRTEPSGFEGLKALEEEDYGLVICDVAMPGMDGFQVFEKVLALKPDQKFLFMTGYTFEGSRQELIDKSLGLLKKPFHLNELNVAISGVYADIEKV
jgi:CheY-like chemotaxis protein